MLKEMIFAVALCLATTSCATTGDPASAVRIDATSDATAKESFASMIETLDREQREKLLVSMIQLNLVDVGSAYDVMQNPELKSLSITGIKDQVDGMTAQEIIDLAKRTSTVETEIIGR